MLSPLISSRKMIIKRFLAIPITTPLFLFLISFSWLFLLSFHFPFMYTDDITYIIEAAKDISFPQGPVLFPRFFFIYTHKILFFLTGFQPFYFHLMKTFFGAAFILVYYSFARHILSKKYAFFSSILLLTSALFISTTVWIAEPITLALLLLTLTLYLLLFYPDRMLRNILLLLLVPAALFTKETNIVILPLLFYYFLFKEQGIKKLYCLFPTILFFIYFFFVPTREHIEPTLSNITYFLYALSEYYTPILVLFVLIFIVFFVYQKIKTKTHFQYDTISFILFWFLLSFMFFFLPINQEERYLMILLPQFFLLFFLGLEMASKIPSYQNFKKILFVLLFILFFYIFFFNIYEIAKFEIGWGSFFKGVDAVATKIDVEYPGSLLVYQSSTGDFFSEFHQFETYQFADSINLFLLHELQQNSIYTHILYVEYPKEIRIYSNDHPEEFTYLFTIQRGIYDFHVYEFDKK